MLMANFVIAATVVAMLGYGINNINSKQMQTAVTEKEREVSMAMLKRGLASYYYSHSSTYPDAVNRDVLRIMGLEGLDVTGFNYTLNADGTYTLIYSGGEGNIGGN